MTEESNIPVLSLLEDLPTDSNVLDRVESWIQEYPYSAHLWLLKGLLNHRENGQIDAHLLEEISLHFPDKYLLGLWFQPMEAIVEPELNRSIPPAIKTKPQSKKKKKKAKEGKRLKKLIKAQTEQVNRKKSTIPFVEWLHSLPNSDPASYRLEQEEELFQNNIEPNDDDSGELVMAQTNLVSEELAKLLLRQGHIKDSKDMYQKLKLKIPEKSALFAQILEDLEK